MKEKLTFPKGFLWGAATSAHQVEGNNIHSDWWKWEHSLRRELYLRAHNSNPEDFLSGPACDSYNRYDEDFSLAQQMSHNAHRLSVEWARIEPKEGEILEQELDHYEQVLQSAKFHGLTTFVTLHHFTCPVWFMEKGGFEKQENINYFIRYAELVASRLRQYADFWITINEPETYSSVPYMAGVWPPQKHNVISGFRVALHLAHAHNLVAPAIKRITGKPVSMAFHLVDLQPTHGLSGQVATFFRERINRFVLERTIHTCDFIGVNYYFHHHVSLFGKRKKSLSNHEVSDIGWGIHPEGLEAVLMSLKKYRKPMYITENGLADAHDQKREKFIRDHLLHVHRAIQKGCDVRGYLHWSLLDNFEWAQGFVPCFGLVEVDRENLLRRKIRSSALAYAEICKSNCLELP